MPFFLPTHIDASTRGALLLQNNPSSTCIRVVEKVKVIAGGKLQLDLGLKVN